MFLTKLTILVLLILQVKGEKVILVSEEQSINSFGELNDEKSQAIFSCCTTGNCTCHSLLHALVNLTDNVVINIITDVVLSSIVSILGVKNIAVVGYNNPTVYCNNTGGVKFVSCNNVIIDGIIWEGCGSNNITNSNPILEMYNCSNITLQNCTFQQSVGQAVALSKVMNTVTINNCTFSNNTHYRGHGSAISQTDSQVLLAVNDCKFTDNKAKSVVYINANSLHDELFILCDSSFFNNQATPIYIISQTIHICGNTVFKDNKGGSIFITDHSKISFNKYSNVSFLNNVAINGGAIQSMNNSCISFESAFVATFRGNRATIDGGAIHSIVYSVISFQGNSSVILTNNMATRHGGAIYSFSKSTLCFQDNSRVLFTLNRAKLWGGSILSYDNCKIVFANNSIVQFASNSVRNGRDQRLTSSSVPNGFGGAIGSYANCSVLFSDITEVTFYNNTATYGGAVISFRHSSLTFVGHSNVTFDANNAGHSGGGICLSRDSMISVEDNSKIVFKNNKAFSFSVIYSSFFYKYCI